VGWVQLFRSVLILVIFINYIIQKWKRGDEVGLVTRLRVVGPRNCSLFPIRSDIFFSTPETSWWILRSNQAHVQYMLEGTGPEGGARLTTHLHLVSRYRMNGAVPVRPHIHPWRAHKQSYIYLNFNRYDTTGCVACFRNVFLIITPFVDLNIVDTLF
jgi:hypothetical protein